MGRIRTIKPAFFRSSDTARLSLPARLFFLGLLTELDDEGRAPYQAKFLAGALFPLDLDVGTEDIDRWTDECVQAGLLVRYGGEGREFVASPTFRDHQRVNRPSPSNCPAPPGWEPRAAVPPARLALHAVAAPGTEHGTAMPATAGEPPGFAEFWEAYPRREAKPRAIKAFASALRVAPFSSIMAGVAAWSASWTATETDVAFVPHPATWLNERRWDDTPPPAPRSRNARLIEMAGEAAAAMQGGAS